MVKEHAQQHAESIKSGGSYQVADDSPVREAWRKGDVEALAAKEALKETLAAQAETYAIEEKKLSKHAKRRANKKKKIVVSGGVEQEDEYQPGGDDEAVGGDQQ